MSLVNFNEDGSHKVHFRGLDLVVQPGETLGEAYWRSQSQAHFEEARDGHGRWTSGSSDKDKAVKSYNVHKHVLTGMPNAEETLKPHKKAVEKAFGKSFDHPDIQSAIEGAKADDEKHRMDGVEENLQKIKHVKDAEKFFRDKLGGGGSGGGGGGSSSGSSSSGSNADGKWLGRKLSKSENMDMLMDHFAKEGSASPQKDAGELADRMASGKDSVDDRKTWFKARQAFQDKEKAAGSGGGGGGMAKYTPTKEAHDKNFADWHRPSGLRITPGMKVKVHEGGGLSAGFHGTVVHPSQVPKNGRGIPFDGEQGDYKPMGSEHVGVKNDHGHMIVVPKSTLLVPKD